MDRTTIREVQFTCPHCKGTTVEEFTLCDGIRSEILGLSERGDAQYGDSIGEGDVYDVKFRCAECEEEIDCDCREDLLDLGYITLGDPVDANSFESRIRKWYREYDDAMSMPTKARMEIEEILEMKY